MKTQRSTESSLAYAGFYPVIAPLIMRPGVGDGKTTACVMAQAATIDALRKGQTLDEPTDNMECACPLLRRMAIRANDADWWKSDTERTEFLRPLIPLLLDSRVSKKLTRKRIFNVVDNVVRVLTPMRLEFIGRKEDVENIAILRGLPAITDKASAISASKLLRGMKSSAYAYPSADAYADAYADASASADADASASAYAYASADAYASAYAYADTYAQKLKYRTAYLGLFRSTAAIK